MTGRFGEKVALVTGGGSGIGRATALAFAREGARVVVVDVNTAGGSDTVSMIRRAGGESVFVYADVTKATEVEAMVIKATEVYGRLDCAHNNAGILGENALLHELTEEAWNQVIAVNLTGIWLCMRYEIIQMLKQGAGAIVNTASVAGLVGYSVVAYGASKHGVVGLTKSAALQYAEQGIRVNAVCPGGIHTPMTDRAMNDPDRAARAIARHPVGRLGTSDEVAEAVVWLCSDAASFVTGHSLVVDGGYVAQ